MGSSLFLNRKTAFGTTQREQIWGKDFEENVRLFNLHSEYLNPIHPNDIQADKVIPYFENIRLPLLPFRIRAQEVVYQSLIDFCTHRPDGLKLTNVVLDSTEIDIFEDKHYAEKTNSFVEG